MANPEYYKNILIAKSLEPLLAERKARKNKYSAKAYQEAITSILNADFEINSGKDARKLPGVGKKIADKIDEFLATGIAEVDKSKADTIVKDPVLESFKEIFGVGEVTAKKWKQLGYTSPSQIPSSLCTRNQQIGLKYYKVLRDRIPRNLVEIVEQIIKKWLSILTILNGQAITEIKISGSYRRGRETCGDIDLLLVNTLNETDSKTNLINFLLECPNNLDDIILPVNQYSRGKVSDYRKQESQKLFESVMTRGEKKIMAIYKLSNFYQIINNNLYGRIDVQLVSVEQANYALLYFTGSAENNIRMRQKAIEMGYRLNEYSLIDNYGRHLPAESEQKIFEHLNLPYLEPEDR